MWGYYGSKSKIINSYPQPIYDTIIEPFAGTAQYSLKYFEKDIILVDKYDVIVRLWKWLQQCSKEDILNLPILNYKDNINDFNWDCDEAKWLVGFIIGGAASTPRNIATKWKTILRPNTQNYKQTLIAENLYKIKHWKIIQGDYNDISNQKATWFIDPPYQFGGEYYKYHDINYPELAEWCKSREGQVIVCENSKATWMDFHPLVNLHGALKNSVECIWENNKQEIFNMF